jgi:predicted DNA-binding protein (UPF0251 family)
MLDLEPIKKKLAFRASEPRIVTVFRKTQPEDIDHADIAAMVKELEALRLRAEGEMRRMWALVDAAVAHREALKDNPRPEDLALWDKLDA